MVDGTTLSSAQEFTYLGSTMVRDGCIEAEIQRRMSKASMYFGRLRERLWNNHHVSTRVKGKINRAVVLSSLLYGAETWTVYRSQVNKRHAFMMRRLRSIMKIKWRNRVTNMEILKRAGLPSMEDLLIRKTLALDRTPSENADRSSAEADPLPSGERRRGRPRLWNKDTIKRNLKKREIETNSWTSRARQRDAWRVAVG